MSDNEGMFRHLANKMVQGDFTANPDLLIQFLGGVFFDKIEGKDGKISHHAKVSFGKQGIVEITFDERSFFLLNRLADRSTEENEND